MLYNLLIMISSYPTIINLHKNSQLGKGLVVNGRWEMWLKTKNTLTDKMEFSFKKYNWQDQL